MAYDANLADRIRTVLVRRRGITEKRMFGGLSFLSGGKMATGVIGKKLVVRVPVDQTARYLKNRHTRPMDFTGRSLAGFIYVMPDGYKRTSNLKKWVTLSVTHVATLAPAKKKPPGRTPPKATSWIRRAAKGSQPKRVKQRVRKRTARKS